MLKRVSVVVHNGVRRHLESVAAKRPQSRPGGGLMVSPGAQRALTVLNEVLMLQFRSARLPHEIPPELYDVRKLLCVGWHENSVLRESLHKSTRLVASITMWPNAAIHLTLAFHARGGKQPLHTVEIWFREDSGEIGPIVEGLYTEAMRTMSAPQVL